MNPRTLQTPVEVKFPKTEDAGRISGMARGLLGSEVLKIAAEVRAIVAAGKDVCNLTVGDFSSTEFRIPRLLEDKIAELLRKGETNYPPSNGVPQLRDAVVAFYERWLGLKYPVGSVLVAGGSRPIIYGAYRAVCDPGDKVVYPVPSWNNNHYCHLSGVEGVKVVCGSADAFLPTAALLRPHLRGARLLSLNSPLNPSGTVFSERALGDICDAVLEENARPERAGRPLCVLYDQVYWMLTFGAAQHCNPVSLRPDMAPYTIFVDGISKAFAATGVRVGWTLGPEDIVDRMSNHLGHVGAWAPKAEQLATAALLQATDEIVAYHKDFKSGLKARLDALHAGIAILQAEGFPVESIAPMGAIYLSARFNLIGRRTPAGQTLGTNEDIRRHLLEDAGMAVVPFQAFGLMDETGWFRLSVGAVSPAQIDALLPRLKATLQKLAG